MNNKSDNEIFNTRKTFVSFCSLGLAGILIFSLLPLLLGTIATELKLTPIEAGATGSIYFAGYTLIAITSFLWFNKVSWKKVSIFAYFTTAIALLIANFIRDYNSILFAMFLLGFSGAIFYVVSTGIVAKTEHVDRNYALKMFPEQITPAILVALLPWLVIERWGMVGLLFSILTLYMIIAITTFWIPKNTQVEKSINWSLIFQSKLAFLSLLGLLVSFSGFIGLWAFMELIAREYNFSEENSALIIMLSLIVSGVAPLCSGLVGDRFGRAKPIIYSLVILISTYFLLTFEVTIVSFAAFFLILIACYYYSLPYVYAIISDADLTGDLVVLISAALAVGSMFGTFLFGFLMEIHGLNTAYIVSLAFITCGTLLTLYVQYNLPKK